MFGWTGVAASAYAYVTDGASNHRLGGALANLMFVDGRTVVIVAMYGPKLVDICVVIPVMTLPQFALFMRVAITHGLVARHVRCALGGHELGSFHHARRRLLFRLNPFVATVWTVVPAPLLIDGFFWPVSRGSARRTSDHGKAP